MWTTGLDRVLPCVWWCRVTISPTAASQAILIVRLIRQHRHVAAQAAHALGREPNHSYDYSIGRIRSIGPEICRHAVADGDASLPSGLPEVKP